MVLYQIYIQTSDNSYVKVPSIEKHASNRPEWYLQVLLCFKANALCKSDPHNIFADGYGVDDVNIRWLAVPNPVKPYSDIRMAQFTLKDIRHGNMTMPDNHGMF